MNKDKKIQHLEKVCSDYCMDSCDVYSILINKNDEAFPLSFETVRSKVLKDISSDILKEIFTNEELKTIFKDINIKKIKDEQTKRFIKTLF